MSQKATFNALKYPISACPTEEELTRIPKFLRKLWFEKTLGVDKDTPIEFVVLSLRVYSEKNCIDKEVQRLRDAIKLL